MVSEEIVNNRVYEIRRFPVKLEENRVGVGGFVRDITKRKRAEEEVKIKTLNLESERCAEGVAETEGPR